MTPPMPADAARATSALRESRECCTTPGIDEMGRASVAPSRTNSGRISSEGCTRVSATSRRQAGVARRRRGRTTGAAFMTSFQRREVGRAVRDSFVRDAGAELADRILRVGGVERVRGRHLGAIRRARRPARRGTSSRLRGMRSRRWEPNIRLRGEQARRVRRPRRGATACGRASQRASSRPRGSRSRAPLGPGRSATSRVREGA